MSRPWILISPSSRGIGAALTTHLLRTTALPILATARRDAPALRDSFLSAPGLPSSARDRLHVLELDVTKEPTMAEAARRAAELFPTDTHHLHLALTIPGILHPEKNPAQVDYEKALETYKVNTLGPLMLMKHFYQFLPRNTTKIDMSPATASSTSPSPSSTAHAAADSASAYGGHEQPSGTEEAQKKQHHQEQQHEQKPTKPAQQQLSLPAHATWLCMSARVGSITDNRAGGWYSYRSSKAGVTALAKSLDNFLRSRSGDKALAVAYHPGTTKTDLSKGFWDSVPKETLLEPDYAVERMVEVVSGLSMEQRGKFFDWKGEEVAP